MTAVHGWTASSRRRRFGLVVAGVLFAGLVLSSCGPSGYVFTHTPDGKAYFKVPNDWKQYTKREILLTAGLSLTSRVSKELPYVVAYDSDPRPSLTHAFNLNVNQAPPRYPVVIAEVRDLNFFPPADRDAFSLGQMRNLLYPIDQLAQSNQVDVISYKDDVVHAGGVRGIEMLFQASPKSIANVTPGDRVVQVYQTVAVDPATKSVYVFAVRCETHCYRDNRALIDQIVSSWTLKER